MFVEFGNATAIEGYRDPNSDDPEKVRYREAPGQRITQVVFPEGTTLMDAFRDTVQLAVYHLGQGNAPAWIDSDEASLEALLEDHFGLNRRHRRPKNWGQDTGADLVPRMAQIMQGLMCLTTVGKLLVVLQAVSLDVRTNAGRDHQCNVMGGGNIGGAGTGAMRPADYIGVTANNAAPDATNTSLTGEITTGTLARSQAAYAHTTGTASYTLTKTFTSDQSVTINKIGVFNAPTAGIMTFETTLNAPATMVSGDQLAVTETITV